MKEKMYLVIERAYTEKNEDPDVITGMWKFASLDEAQELMHKLHEAAAKKYEPDEDYVGTYYMSMRYTTSELLWSCELNEFAPIEWEDEDEEA